MLHAREISAIRPEIKTRVGTSENGYINPRETRNGPVSAYAAALDFDTLPQLGGSEVARNRTKIRKVEWVALRYLVHLRDAASKLDLPPSEACGSIFSQNFSKSGPWHRLKLLMKLSKDNS